MTDSTTALIDVVRAMGENVTRRSVLNRAGIRGYADENVAFRDALCAAMGVTPDDEGLLGAFARCDFDVCAPFGFCGEQGIRLRGDSPFAAMCRALLEAYDRLPHDADGKVLHVGDHVMLAPGVEGDCDAHHGMRSGDVLCVSDPDFSGWGIVALGDVPGHCGYYLETYELVHAPTVEEAIDSDETDAPDPQPEPWEEKTCADCALQVDFEGKTLCLYYPMKENFAEISEVKPDDPACEAIEPAE